MNNIYRKLNSVQSHLVTWGEPLNLKQRKDVIICITGNPGLVDFYSEFGSELYETTNMPICVIGHAGHEKLSDTKSDELKGHEHLYNLNGQINHKLDLINNHIAKDCKLHFIGHSIGSWMILELLQENKSLLERVSTVNLLFPTVQKMASSRNGKILNNIVRRLHIFIMLLVKLLDILPSVIVDALINMHMILGSIPSQFKEAISKFACFNVIQKVLFLSYDEMDRVQSLNTDIINIIKDKTFVVYCDNDGWAPVTYMNDFKIFEPYLKLKKVDTEHAFVLRSSVEIADMVSDFIKYKM